MQRAAARHYSLTDEQMQALHHAPGAFEAFDVAIDISFTSLADSVSKICKTLDQRESDR
jgi:hypothetical protein